jgi:hypothetical protein
LRHAAGLDPDHLPPTLDVPAIRRAMEVLKVFTQDEQEREIYEARLKLQRDQISWAQEARDAEERGIKKGLVEQIHLCQELLKQSPTPAAELDPRSQEDLRAILAQLRKQGLPNGA